MMIVTSLSSISVAASASATPTSSAAHDPIEIPPRTISHQLLVDHRDRVILVSEPDINTVTLHRYRPDGSPDPTFGADGAATFGGRYVQVTLLDDGSFALQDFVDNRSRVRHVLESGIADSAYGDQGEILTDGFHINHNSFAAVGPDGTAFEIQGPGRFGAVRHDPTGRPDPTYGDDGFAAIPCCDPPPGSPDYGVMALADGSLLLSGSDGPRFYLHRLGPDGTLAGSFGSDQRFGDPTPLPDGAIHMVDGQITTTIVQRHRSDLSVDSSFGLDGQLVLTGGSPEQATADGRHYVVTRDPAIVGGKRTVRVHAIDHAGLDPSFGQGGVVTIEVDPWPAGGNLWLTTNLAATSDGGLVLSWTARLGPPAPFAQDQRSRLIQFSAAGDEVWSTSGSRITYPVALSGARAVVAFTVEPPASTVVTPPNLVRRFDLALPAVAPFTSVAAFADRLVQDTQGRPATASEIVAFEQAIADGTTASTLVRLQVAQRPWATNLDPVVRLYWAYFGRPPDPSGLRYWIGRRAAGVSVARISSVFADSSEFRRTYGSLDDRAFVELVYQNVLERRGDPAGVAFWTGRVQRRVTSRGQLMASFSESTEHVRRRADQVATVSLFFALLGRTPTAGELAAWTGPDPVGGPDALVRSILRGPEYAVRVGRG